MSCDKIAVALLRGVGGLLVALGLVHLAATPHIPALLDGTSSTLYRHAVGPTLLNHVLVGILLLPLGYTTWIAATAAARSEPWARSVLTVNAIVLLALPVSIVLFMREPEYYRAPLFVTGVVLVALLSLLTMTSVGLLLREHAGTRPRSG